MFLIWGKSTRIIKTYIEGYISCEQCKSRNVEYVVHQTYYHLFWVPIFPLLKTVGIYCNNCKDSHEEIYSKTALEYEKQTKTPIYMYSWTIIILSIIAYIILK